MLAPQHGDRRPQHGGGGIHARAAFEAERCFLVDGVAAAVQVMRAEVRPEHLLELPDLDAPEFARRASCRSRPPAAAAPHRRSPRRSPCPDAARAAAQAPAARRARGRRSCSSRAGRPIPGRRAATSSMGEPLVDQRLPRYTARNGCPSLNDPFRACAASQHVPRLTARADVAPRHGRLPIPGKPHRLCGGRPLGHLDCVEVVGRASWQRREKSGSGSSRSGCCARSSM